MRKFFKGHRTEKEPARSAKTGEQTLQPLDDSLLQATTGGVRTRKVVIVSIGTPPPPLPPPGEEDERRTFFGHFEMRS
jgi:hypothetical protein